MLNTTFTAKPFSIFYIILAWAIYSGIIFGLKFFASANDFSAIPPMLDTVLLVTITISSFVLWKKASTQNKKIFMLYALASILFTIVGIIYTVSFVFLKIPYENFTPFWISARRVPYLCGMGLVLTTFVTILGSSKIFKPKVNILIYLFCIVIFCGLFLAFFSAYEWTNSPSVLENIYDTLSSILELSVIVIALFCLALAKHRSIFNLSLSYLIILPGTFLMNFHLFSGTLGAGAFMETTWSLGFALIIYSFYIFKKTSGHLESATKWLNPADSLKTQFTLRMLMLVNLALLVFLLAVYIFFPNSLTLGKQGLLESFFPIFVTFSIVTILLGRMFANKLCYPLQRLNDITDAFINEKPVPLINHTQQNILEYRNIENLLAKTFYITHEKNKAQQNLIALASQVAHDIRSPLSALNAVAKDILCASENTRLMTRNAIRRINDIANNLLTKYRGKEDVDNTGISSELLLPVLDSIVSEKRAQLGKQNIQFNIESEDAYALFSAINLPAFKRVFSNLLGNAMEAIKTTGTVSIGLMHTLGKVNITITDDGIGIASDLLPHIFERGVSSKKEGNGLGLTYAKECIESWNGTISVQSEINKGTKVTITLPRASDPKWFAKYLTIKRASKVIIVDDDESVHGVWVQRLINSNSLAHVPPIKHFYNPLEFKLWCEQNRCSDDVYLIDYEFVNINMSGIALIQSLQIMNQAILVTSHYEESEIRHVCERFGLKIVPKSLAMCVPISFQNGQSLQPDCVIIDDDDGVLEAWRCRALASCKKVAAFESVEEFMQAMHNYPRNIPIYIDSELRSNIKGEIAAKAIHDNGFTEIFLATGYSEIKIRDYPWLKSIVEKDPPF